MLSGQRGEDRKAVTKTDGRGRFRNRGCGGDMVEETSLHGFTSETNKWSEHNVSFEKHLLQTSVTQTQVEAQSPE